MTDTPPCSGSGVRPPRSLLSGRDLLEHHVSTYDLRGLPSKLTCAEEEPDQAETVQRLKDEFRQVLAQNRVGKAELYSEGEWQRDRKRVRVRRATGKWNLFGYTEDKVHYLDGYEALHLMEMNRLLVYWNSVLVSIEQAYTLFLGYKDSLSLEEYQVYSSLMKAGFYLLKFDCNRKYRLEVTEKELDDETKCVWKNLFEVLKQPNPLIDEEVQDEALKDKVRSSMQQFNTAIILQEFSTDLKEDDEASSSNKRKISLCSEEQVTKRHKSEQDTLQKDPENPTRLAKFQQLFQRFDIVRNSLDEVPQGNPNTKLKLLFDMFPSDVTNFKRSEPMLPEYRIVVTTTGEPLPTAADVAHLYRSQPQTASVPILVMQVADTLTIHCFLYSFYRLGRNLITARAPERDRVKARGAAAEDEDEDIAVEGSSESLVGEGNVDVE